MRKETWKKRTAQDWIPLVRAGRYFWLFALATVLDSPYLMLFTF